MPHYLNGLEMEDDKPTLVVERQPDIAEIKDEYVNVKIDDVLKETEKKNETEQYKIFQDRLKNAFMSNEDYHLFNKLPLTDKQKVELVLDMLVKESNKENEEPETTSNEVVCDS